MPGASGLDAAGAFFVDMAIGRDLSGDFAWIAYRSIAEHPHHDRRDGEASIRGGRPAILTRIAKSP